MKDNPFSALCTKHNATEKKSDGGCILTGSVHWTDQRQRNNFSKVFFNVMQSWNDTRGSYEYS